MIEIIDRPETMSTDTDNITIKRNEPMSAHTSWRAGGVARQYVQAASTEALAKFLSTLPDDEPVLWMGLGSNTLVRDGGYNGTVIATQGVMTQLKLVDETSVYVGAGVPGAKLARFCDRHGLTGAEFFAGIPGVMGGALAMNAGAFGGETWPLVKQVETMNRKGEIRTRMADEYRYGYRHVAAPEDVKDEEWFASASLQLKKHNAESKQLNIKQLLAKKAASQPTGVASCGSVFRNPEGDYAARLIEQSGLKGYRIGGAMVSLKHANFIINDRHATATDIENLIIHLQKTVKDIFDIELQPEVCIVGDSKVQE